MKISEQVTFGASGLDRAAQLRTDIGPVLQDPGARTLVLWRGKLLICGEGDGLMRLPLDHPILEDAGPTQVFLGLDDAGPLFAATLANWDPDLPEADQMQAFLDQTIQHHPATGDIAHFAELRGIMAGLTRRDAELAATAKSVLGWHRSHLFCSYCGAESAPADAGWRRHCVTCGTSHFPRTDPVVIMLVERDDHVLLGRSPGWPEGMYSLLAGFVEPGETIENAVRREVLEEAGIEVAEVTYLSSQPWAFPSSLMIGCHGVAASDQIKLDPAELEDARWVSRADIEQASRGAHPWLKPARKGAIAHFLLENWLADRLG